MTHPVQMTMYRIAVKDPEWRWANSHDGFIWQEPHRAHDLFDIEFRFHAWKGELEHRFISRNASGTFTLPDAPPEVAPCGNIALNERGKTT